MKKIISLLLLILGINLSAQDGIKINSVYNANAIFKTVKINTASLPSSDTYSFQVGCSKMTLGDKSTNQTPTFIEFFKGDGAGNARAFRSSIGFLGTTELNQAVNMDYTTGSHRYYDATIPAAWSYLGHSNGFGIQYVPANNTNSVNIWTNYGCIPFKVEYINQPATGQGINGFSKITSAVLNLVDATNTATTTNTYGILQYTGSKFQISSSGANNVLNFERASQGISYMLFTQAANTYALIGTQRADGTGILPSAEGNSFCMETEGNPFYIGNSTGRVLKITGTKTGIMQFTPTAYLHLGAGTTTANTAPLKFTSGTNNTTAETGAMEYNGTNLFFTRTGTVRENVLTTASVNTVSPTSPNRTISVVIDGTTYYISAKTTND